MKNFYSKKEEIYDNLTKRSDVFSLDYSIKIKIKKIKIKKKKTRKVCAFRNNSVKKVICEMVNQTLASNQIS